MAQVNGTNGRIVPWVIDRETVGSSGLTRTLYPVCAKKCEGGLSRERPERRINCRRVSVDAVRATGDGSCYFSRWSEISAASSAGSTTPSRVNSSLPAAKKCVVG